MTSTPDVHALIGPYVLNAVDDLERAGFEQHLAGCTDCGAEVAELREAVTKLSSYVAKRPPAILKSKAMTAAGQVRQLRPVPRGETNTARIQSARSRVLRRSLTLAAAFLIRYVKPLAGRSDLPAVAHRQRAERALDRPHRRQVAAARSREIRAGSPSGRRTAPNAT